MANFVRYLVSQRLGRVIVTIDTNRSNTGMAYLNAANFDGVPISFTFPVRALKNMANEQCEWPELVTRLAVAQIHAAHRHGSQPAPHVLHVLNLSTIPWIGDIATSAEPDNTLGVRHHSARRRSNGSTG